MKIFIAGATGAMGSRLLPILTGAGHQVVGTTRIPAKADAIRAAGAEAVVLDALNADSVMKAMQNAKPDVVVHQLTAIPARLNIGKFDRDFAMTNRLRTQGTDNLLAAARDAGIRRFIAQSFAGWPYAREGGRVKTEDDPLDSRPPAERHCEYAFGYGPKTLNRVLRMQCYLKLSKTNSTLGLTGLAAAAGYADQAHSSREARSLTDLTPKTLLAQLANRRGVARVHKTRRKRPRGSVFQWW